MFTEVILSGVSHGAHMWCVRWWWLAASMAVGRRGGCPYVVCQAAVGSFVAGWRLLRARSRIVACRGRMWRWARARAA